MTDAKAIAALWCSSYLEAFNQHNVSAIAQHWAFPALILTGGRRFIYDRADKFERNTSGLLDFYLVQGVKRGRRACLAADYFTPIEIAMRVEDHFYDDEGGLIATWRAGYVLQKVAGKWGAVLASADGEAEAWRARGTPLPGT